MKIGLIGLGNLGKAIARRLLDEGVELIVWNRSPDKARDLLATIAQTPTDVARTAEIIFLNLFDSDAVSAVLEGPDGLLKADCTNHIIIDTTTNHFESAESFHGLLRQHRAHYLEAPVLGSVFTASQGNLTILVSGQQQALDTALPYLQKIGRNIFNLGVPGLATKMKLVNNMVLASFVVTLAEAVAFGEDVGIEKDKVLEILSVGAGNSTVLSGKREKFLKEDFTPHFSSAAIYKDLRYMQDLARHLNKPLFTGNIAKELFAMTFPQGLDQLDFSAVYKVFRRG